MGQWGCGTPAGGGTGFPAITTHWPDPGKEPVSKENIRTWGRYKSKPPQIWSRGE